MTYYDKSTFTYGCEVNLPNALRSTEIPDRIGSWEYSEHDIVNTVDPYRGVAVDPLGIDPPVGGEVNMTPDTSPKNQADKIGELLSMFPDVEYTTFDSHHVHIRVPGLRDDLPAMKRLVEYSFNNMKFVQSEIRNKFEETQDMKDDKALAWLRNSCGTCMPVWLKDNLLGATSIEEFYRIAGCGKDGKTKIRAARYLVNIFSIIKMDTIEFRCFRSTKDTDVLLDHIRFVEEFVYSAINGGESAEEIVSSLGLTFAHLPEYSSELFLGWKNTKYSSSRSKKKIRTLITEVKDV